MQGHKNIKIFLNYFLGPLLALWLCFSIYHQIRYQSHLAASWRQVQASFASAQIIFLAGAAGLIAANWGLEARKWQLLVAAISPVSFGQAYKAVLSGVSFAVSTPNRIGEYAGRMFYLPDGCRLKSIAVTLVGSMAQLLVTLYAGLLGLIILKPALNTAPFYTEVLYRFLVFGLAGFTLLLTLFYFKTAFIGGLLHRWLRPTRYGYLVQALQSFGTVLLWRIMWLSVARYAVFLLQYLLVFQFFGVAVPPLLACCALGIMFLAMAVIPSVALAEVGLRGQISLALLGLFSANSLGIGLASVSIWFLNLVLPAVAGTGLILQVRVFKKRNETV